MTKREQEILIHALGRSGYRNYFAAGQGSKDYEHCCNLVDRGFMFSRTVPWIPDTIFHATELGQAAIGIYYQED